MFERKKFDHVWADIPFNIVGNYCSDVVIRVVTNIRREDVLQLNNMRWPSTVIISKNRLTALKINN